METSASGLRTLSQRDVAQAARRLATEVLRTPVVRNDELDQLASARLWLKAENLQRSGSFKIRGALNALARLSAAGHRGVVAQSTGNHGIAVAMAARRHGLRAVLVLPSDASGAKVRRIQDTGAEVVLVGTALAEREAVVRGLRDEYKYAVVDPYEDPAVVAGQGTATAELLDQVDDAGGTLDAVVVPVGGGSAIAGARLAVGERDIELVAAEPAAVPALTAALHAGEPVTVASRPTMADGLRPDRIGQLPFALVHGTVTTVLAMEETAIADAMRLALECLRLVIEPAAATALAGALRLASDRPGQYGDIGVLLSGGNVEPQLIGTLSMSARG